VVFEVLAPAGPPFRVGGASFKAALLVFALSEKVTLADPAAANAPPTEAEVETYSYAAIYLGGGVALSWQGGKLKLVFLSFLVAVFCQVDPTHRATIPFPTPGLGGNSKLREPLGNLVKA
jgi:hypothetical protein